MAPMPRISDNTEHSSPFEILDYVFMADIPADKFILHGLQLLVVKKSLVCKFECVTVIYCLKQK